MSSSDLRQLLLERARHQPEKIAYSFIQDSGLPLSITYQQLLHHANSVSEFLLKESGREAGRALLIYPPGFDFLYALFGCFLSGTQTIPIAIPKPKTQELFKHFINHAHPHLILTHTSLEKRIGLLLQDQNKTLPLVCTDALKPVTNTPFDSKEKSNIAVIQYTSGTTTLPKGVLVTYENLAHNLTAIKNHFRLTSQSVCYSWLPHHHDMGLIDGLLTPIVNDCLGILSSPLFVISNPTHWLQVITDYKVTHTGGPNFFFDLCVDKVASDRLSQFDLRSLTHLYVSAESVRKKTLHNFSTHFSSCGFQQELFTPGYGLAEATLMVTCKELNSPVKVKVKDGNEYVGLGKVIPDMKIKILDPTTSAEVDAGIVGEICVSGPSLTPGYFGDEARTRESRLVFKNETYFKTGDLGFLEQEELYVVGRLKDTLNIRGTNYQPEDLEYIIAQCHPLLAATPCAVISILQEVEKIVVLQEIKRDLADHNTLQSIKESIAHAIFIAFGLSVFDIKLLPQGSLLKTTSGKVKRLENRARYEKGLLKTV